MSPSRPQKDLRLFVAVYPPPETAGTLLASLARLELPPHRLVAPEQVHMTVHFIGDTPPQNVDAIGETVRHAARGLAAFALTPQQLIALPSRPPARLVAAETDRPTVLMELQRRLVTRLARNTRQQVGDRFRPHLTLCRFQTPTRLRAIEAPLCVPSFVVETVAVVRSTLRPEGAHHETLDAINLR